MYNGRVLTIEYLSIQIYIFDLLVYNGWVLTIEKLSIQIYIINLLVYNGRVLTIENLSIQIYIIDLHSNRRLPNKYISTGIGSSLSPFS